MNRSHTTVTQNAAHRADVAWHKASVDRSVTVKGEWWISEYRNPFTGQTIRKSGRMTGRDWFVFDADGNVTGRAHSLTWAKLDAAKGVEA
jgi:hypothetical protein